MVVNNFDFIRLVVHPEKAHPVLIVDTNAILTIPMARSGAAVYRSTMDIAAAL